MFNHSLASKRDIPELMDLMEISISNILGKMLDEYQFEAARESMGLDTQLIEDRSYFLVRKDDVLIGSGGYSYRQTLFGGNHTPNRSDDLLNPSEDSAKIRAMYTHPDWTRLGVGSYILDLAEENVKNIGFKSIELMATVSGRLLYEKKGYQLVEEIEYVSMIGNKVPMYKMEKKFDE